MNKDFLDPINAKRMPNLADSMFALDFLMTVKTGIRNYAVALTETASPDIRVTMQSQLEEALDMHDKISTLMMNKGWLYPYNLADQYQLDLKSLDTTLQIAQLKLFPDNTSRLGAFATLDTQD